MVGEYRSAEGAELALDQVKKAGYSDAFIVSLIDGERKSYAAGKEKINPADELYNNLKRAELARILGEKNSQEQNPEIDKPKTGTISGTDIRQVQGLVYLVQLGMYQKPRTYAKLNNLQPIYTDKIAGKGTRYMMGTYPTIAKAREENKRAANSGIKDSYVIAYYNGENISLEKAQKIESTQIQNQNPKQDLSQSSIIFMVQVGAYSQKLDLEEENKLKAAYTPRNLESRFSENMNVYLLGNYKTYKEADFLKKKLVSEGHQGIFVVAFNGDKKISVADAIKLNKSKE
jgi:hypothetical protein